MTPPRTSDGIIVVDASARVMFMNSVAEELTGCSAAQALDQPLGAALRIVDETNGDALADLLNQVLGGAAITCQRCWCRRTARECKSMQALLRCARAQPSAAP